MFERFTPQARQSVVTAQEVGRALGAVRILPVHVLLGAVTAVETSGLPVAGVLSESGLTADRLRAEVQTMNPDLGEEDALALESVGVDLHAVRSAVDAQFGPGALDAAGPAPRRGLFGSRGGGHMPFSRGAKAVLECSLRASMERKDGYIGVEHILLGVLREADPAAMSLIARHTVPKSLEARIKGSMDSVP